jgi:malonyl-CoA O-methyltransferase
MGSAKSKVKNAVKRMLHALGMENLIPHRAGGPRIMKPLLRALAWTRAQELPGGGIRIKAGRPEPYPEVTGYFIPTLLRWGEHDFAVRCARWLVSIQNPDGSWSNPGGHAPYTFDTGQILKGLVAIRRRLPEVDPAIRRGCDWFLTQVRPDGRVVTPDTSAWGLPDGKRVSEYVHLYALEPLRDAAKIFDEPRWAEAVERAVAYYSGRNDLTFFNNLSHIHAYVMEALVDLGRTRLALRGMTEVDALQRKNGAVPAYWDVSWVCSTGLAQYAVVWYKLDRIDRAQRAVECLCRLQNRSGGFYGSYGFGANYDPKGEISWAVKYFLDACYWHIVTAMDHFVDFFEDDIAPTDPRFEGTSQALGDFSGLRVLDAGCGKGPYARRFKALYPSAEIWGMDLSEVLLRRLPSDVRTRQGTLLDIPFEDGTFDRVYCTEALEHAVNPQAAVAELCRVTKPGGRVVILDKNVEHMGELRVVAYEQWFRRADVETWLRRACTDVTSRVLSDPVKPDRSGLFLVWQGTRR